MKVQQIALDDFRALFSEPVRAVIAGVHKRTDT
jgi:hypothetical protein